MQYCIWTDGLCALLGREMGSDLTRSDLDTLISMEMKLRLLDLENITIPEAPPPVPKEPSSYNFTYNYSWSVCMWLQRMHVCHIWTPSSFVVKGWKVRHSIWSKQTNKKIQHLMEECPIPSVEGHCPLPPSVYLDQVCSARNDDKGRTVALEDCS